MNDDVYVEIVSYDTDTVHKRMGPMSARKAAVVERGANINLNHERFFVRVTELVTRAPDGDR